MRVISAQFREKNALVWLLSTVLDDATCPLQGPMSRLTHTPARGCLMADPPLPCKIASPRGLSVTPWGFTTHTHKSLSLAMLPTFIPNSNPNQPCFYLSALSSPIFSWRSSTTGSSSTMSVGLVVKTSSGRGVVWHTSSWLGVTWHVESPLKQPTTWARKK